MTIVLRLGTYIDESAKHLSSQSGIKIKAYVLQNLSNKKVEWESSSMHGGIAVRSHGVEN